MPTRARATRTPRVLSAEIGRFSGEYHKVRFNQGDNVGSLLTKAGLSASNGEQINDDRGRVVNTTDTAKANETYHLTGNFKNGLR